MDQASVILVWLAYLLYAAAFAVFLIGFFSQRPWMNRLGLIVAAAGLVSQTLALILRGVSAGHFPFVGIYESMVLVSWAIVLVWHVLESFTKIKAVGLYVMPVVLVLLTIALVKYNPPTGLAPALRSDIVIVHVSVMLVAIGCLYVAGGAAIIYLIEETLLRRRRPDGVLGRLPSLASLDRLIYHATALGLPFLTMGMAAGVIRAETFKVSGWPTDPMVLLSAAAWAVYLALIAGRVRGDWSGASRLLAGRHRPGAPARHPFRRDTVSQRLPHLRELKRMHVVVAGISHKTASLELRERLALDEEAALRVSQELLDEGVACEAVALSTCNRTELYLYGRDSLAARQAALAHLARHAGVAPGELEPALYSYSGDGAIAHLFRVTSSLDSMVVGEAQIVAQLKAAYQQACDGGCTAVVFNRLFRHALEVGKRVRTETAIGERPVSVSSAAVELALQVFGKLRDHTVLIVGAGETSELTATHLKAHGIEKILVANRTLDTSMELARRVGGAAVRFEDSRAAPRRRRHRDQLHLRAALRRHP